LYQNSATYNPCDVQDAEIDRLVLEAAAIPEEEARNEVYQSLVRRLVEQARYVPVVTAPALFYANSSIDGMAVSPGAQFANPVDFRPAG
jgi:ABC-type transport system substrate-binding protein